MIKGKIKLGKKIQLDKNVLLGYPTQRKIKNKTVVIGDNAKIRSGTIIYHGCKIGSNLETGHNVIIREENIIGKNLSIWNNSTIDYNCRIGDNVKIHCNSYIAQYTVIEDDAFLAPGVTIANDIHPGCAFSKKCMRGPVIEKGAKIGVNVTILPFVRIGKYSLIGSGSVVTKDIPPYSVAYGNPARVTKKTHQLKCIRGYTDKPYKSVKE